MQDFEKLGVFYLGRPYDMQTRQSQPAPLLYDSKDLVTHAVCVGMTGSGKTGLCIGLLEEAAIDGIPAIVIDPKGDLANLLLTFPDLKGADFLPWINEDDARKKGLTPDQFAQSQADTWTKGLGAWGQDGERIRRLKDAADFTIYTPGSTAGMPVSIIKSFAAPARAVLDDPELLQERVRTTATSLLGMVGIDADPIQSREHILLSTLLTNAWQAGKDLDLGALIQQIQSPPIQRIGVLNLDSFFPEKERFGLAMRLNNLLAAPGFENWLKGDPLDVNSLLYTTEGKPRVSIFSIAHLSDAERMFFVSLLLNQTLGWVRTQSGTTSLRAIVYMDEIFGYFPPVANPPSKAPLLTLLKQARAYGVGIVLATQNPVDLDYKGLANAGTWFIGRLQTDRDKQRVLDGLEGAAASTSGRFDRGLMEQTLAGLGNRVFLMNNVNDDAPTVFETRWAMSYLRGPLTRTQIKQLMDPKRRDGQPAGVASGPSVSSPAPVAAEAVEPRTEVPQAPAASSRPVLPSGVPQVFIPVRSNQPPGSTLLYRPTVLGSANVYYSDPKKGLDVNQPVVFDAKLSKRAGCPGLAERGRNRRAGGRTGNRAAGRRRVRSDPATGNPGEKLRSLEEVASGGALSKQQAEPDAFGGAEDRLKSRGERARLSRPRSPAAREERDEQVEKLRQKYSSKVAMVQERIRKAEMAMDVQAKQATSSKLQTAISVGATILGAFLGRKTLSAGNIGKATTAARGVGRSMKESEDVSRAEQNVAAIKQQLDALDAQLQAEISQIDADTTASAEELETVPLKPKKSDITVRTVAWRGHRIGSQGPMRRRHGSNTRT